MSRASGLLHRDTRARPRAPASRGKPILLLIVLIGVTAPASATRIDGPGGTLEVHWDQTLDAVERTRLERWLARAARTVATLDGALPLPCIRIDIEARRDAGEPVPFACVMRGRAPGVRFWVDPAWPLERFLVDWTAPHELVHLFIPFPGAADVWLSEGLSTYYQHILQARDRLLADCTVWRELADGFARGHAALPPEPVTLAVASATMHESGAHMRVYWSGTAFFLEADLALRTAAAPQTLDEVVNGFAACCRDDPAIDDGAALVAAFDRVAGTTLFVPLYERYRVLERLPDTQALLGRLGVRSTDGSLQCGDADAATTRLRRAITRPRSTDAMTLLAKPR
ncbi:MAG: hypothetical protein RLW42_19165 [Gammaproteobacteria bacterium]